MGTSISRSNPILPELKILDAIKNNKPIVIRSQKLNLKDKSIDNVGIKALSMAIAHNTTLSKLHLGNNLIGNDGIKALSEALKINSSVTILYLYCNNIGFEGITALSSALAKNTTLMDLNLGMNEIGVEGATALSSALEKNTTLTDLELYGNKIDDEVAIELSKFIKTNYTLTSLNLNDNKIGSYGACALSQAIAKNVKLLHLNLGKNRIGDDGTKQLSPALEENRTLTNLDLSKNNIADGGAIALSNALKTNTTLAILLLDYNEIGDEGAIQLSSSIRALKRLNLGYNKIGINGAIELSSSLATNSSLTDLSVHRNEFGTQGVKEITTSLRRNTTLKCLNISGNKIDPEGTDAITESFSENNTLERLIIGNEAGEVKISNFFLRRSSEIKKEEVKVIRMEEEKINMKHKDVIDWFQKINLSDNQKEECSKLFIERGYDDLDVIANMQHNDLEFLEDKFKSQPGNILKIQMAIQNLKKEKTRYSSPIRTSQHIHPWHIEPAVKTSPDWITHTDALSLLPLPLNTSEHSLLSTALSKFKDILTSLNGNLDRISSVHLIQSFSLGSRFQLSLDTHLRSLLSNPEMFKENMWKNEGERFGDGDPWRKAIHEKYYEYASKFPNNNNVNRDKGLVAIPVVAGYKYKDSALKICENGPKIVGSTDDGYFGRGLYFSTHINYAKKYGKYLVVFWIFTGNVYPVIEFPHPPVGSPLFYDKVKVHQKPTLCGKPQKNHQIINDLGRKKTVIYDTHYTVVRPFTDEGAPATTLQYVPCEVENMGNDNVFDEVVVFQEGHVLPMYLIECRD